MASITSWGKRDKAGGPGRGRANPPTSLLASRQARGGRRDRSGGRRPAAASTVAAFHSDRDAESERATAHRPGRVSMFRVTMTFAGKPVRKFTFDKPLIAIGRDATCDIVVENIGASRRHATIEKTPEGYVLADLKSHNGTFVGGEKVFHHQLKDTDEFFIGKYAFCFEALEPVTAGAEPEPPPSLPAAAEMTFRLDRKDIERLIGTSQRGAAPQIVQLAPEGERQTVRLDRMYVMIGAEPGAEV